MTLRFYNHKCFNIVKAFVIMKFESVWLKHDANAWFYDIANF